MTILVTGANGTVSREVLGALAGKEPVRALVRDKSRAPDLDGVEAKADPQQPAARPRTPRTGTHEARSAVADRASWVRRGQATPR